MYMHMYVPTFAYPYRNQKLTLAELTKLVSALQGSVSVSACNLEITCEVHHVGFFLRQFSESQNRPLVFTCKRLAPGISLAIEEFHPLMCSKPLES